MVDIGIVGYVNWLQLQCDLFLVNLYDMAQTFPEEKTNLSSGSTVGWSEGKAGVAAFPKFFTRLGSEEKRLMNECKIKQ